MNNLTKTAILKRCLLNATPIHHFVPACTIYSSKKGVSREFLSKVQQPIDLSFKSIEKWFKKRKAQALKEDHSYVKERHKFLGPDLATAHFIVARGGAIKFQGMDTWVQKDEEGKYKLPKFHVKELYLEAVDCTGMPIMYNSFDNFTRLSKLKYLNLSQCPQLDDWCLDRFHQFADTLVVLDLSGCPNVSERGLASLHKLKKLRELVVHDLPNVRHKPMVGVMLEEALPDCRILGLDFTAMPDYEWEPVAETPKFLLHLEGSLPEAERKETIAQESAS